MSGRKNRKDLGALGREAHRCRVAFLHRLRQVAVAEMHRDRARAGLVKALTLVDLGTGAGFDMLAEAAHLGELRQALAAAEAGLDAARRTAGLATNAA